MGNVINPLLLDGQRHGGIVQGYGQAFCERVVYDDDGQLITGTMGDYALPVADGLPEVRVAPHGDAHGPQPAGCEGRGRGRTIGSTPTLRNAVLDALLPLGITELPHAGHVGPRLGGNPGRRQLARQCAEAGDSAPATHPCHPDHSERRRRAARRDLGISVSRTEIPRFRSRARSTPPKTPHPRLSRKRERGNRRASAGSSSSVVPPPGHVYLGMTEVGRRLAPLGMAGGRVRDPHVRHVDTESE